MLSMQQKICNKYHLLHLVGVLFPHINEDARSKSLKNLNWKVFYNTKTLELQNNSVWNSLEHSGTFWNIPYLQNSRRIIKIFFSEFWIIQFNENRVPKFRLRVLETLFLAMSYVRS